MKRAFPLIVAAAVAAFFLLKKKAVAAPAADAKGPNGSSLDPTGLAASLNGLGLGGLVTLVTGSTAVRGGGGGSSGSAGSVDIAGLAKLAAAAGKGIAGLFKSKPRPNTDPVEIENEDFLTAPEDAAGAALRDLALRFDGNDGGENFIGSSIVDAPDFSPDFGEDQSFYA